MKLPTEQILGPCNSCQLTMPAIDKQRKVDCVTRLSKSQRTMMLPTIQTGKLPDTGPCSVLEDNKGVSLRRTISRHILVQGLPLARQR